MFSVHCHEPLIDQGVDNVTHIVEVLSKDGCHLCERAIDVLKELSIEYGFQLEIVDIRKDETLYKDFFLKIPVVKIDRKIVFSAEDVAHPDEYRPRLHELVKSQT